MDDMPFLRFTLGKYEWGFDVPHWCIPAVGDIVTLWHGLPDQESNDAIDCVVVQRQWPLSGDFEEYAEIWYEVETSEVIPDDHVADSTAWPSVEWSERKAEEEERLRRIWRGET